MRGATAWLIWYKHVAEISIHAPREGSDAGTRPDDNERRFQSTLPVRGATNRFRTIISESKISIHAPREGSDYIHAEISEIIEERFQSTLPVRGATSGLFRVVDKIEDFNPRSP